MDVMALLVRGLVLFVALVGLLTLVRKQQPLRRITEAERQAVRAVLEIVVAADASVHRVEGAARQRRTTIWLATHLPRRKRNQAVTFSLTVRLNDRAPTMQRAFRRKTLAAAGNPPVPLQGS